MIAYVRGLCSASGIHIYMYALACHTYMYFINNETTCILEGTPVMMAINNV